MTNLANLLGDLIADLATKASNRALHTDPQLRARLMALTGNTIKINCTLPPMAWYLTIIDGGLHLDLDQAQGSYQEEGAAELPQVIVQGSAADLAAWLLPGESSGRVQIDGDETMLLEVVSILRDFQPDIQHPLGQFLGPQVASTVLGTAELGLQGLRSVLDGVGRSVQGQAGGQYVSRQQLDSLLSGIDELRLKVDRLAAQVAAESAAEAASEAESASEVAAEDKNSADPGQPTQADDQPTSPHPDQ